MSPEQIRTIIGWLDTVPSDLTDPPPDDMAVWEACWRAAGYDMDPGLSATGQRLHDRRACFGLLGMDTNGDNCATCQQALETGRGVIVAHSKSAVLAVLWGEARDETEALIDSGAIRVLADTLSGTRADLDPRGWFHDIDRGPA